MNSEIFFALQKALERPIAFHRVFAEIGGGATEGLFLSQAYYWSKVAKAKDGWFYKSQQEWTEETCLTRREQETARKKLKEKGILEEVSSGIPKKLFFRINLEQLLQTIVDISSNPHGYKNAKNGTSSNPHGYKNVTSDIQACQKQQTVMSEVTDSNVISDILSIYTETTTETTTQNTHSPLTPQGEMEGEAPFSKLVTTESSLDTHTSSNNPTQEERKGAGVVRQTGTIEQPNNYDASFMNNRRQNRLTGNYMSNQFDAWMETANRPDKVFTQWLYQKRYEKQGKLVADAVSEILNNCERAELLWEEYQQEQEKRVQHQNLLKENGMAPAKSETTPPSLPANYKETATAPEIKPLKQSQIPHLRFGKGTSANIPSWQKYANRKSEDLE